MPEWFASFVILLGFSAVISVMTAFFLALFVRTFLKGFIKQIDDRMKDDIDEKRRSNSESWKDSYGSTN